MSDYNSAKSIPTRTLTITARKQAVIAMTWTEPVVVLDGHRFPLPWGTHAFTIPADRPVRVHCEMPYLYTYGRAAIVLEPHHLPQLEYSPPANQFRQGELGAPGTTGVRHGRTYWIVAGILVGVVAPAILIGAAILVVRLF